MTNGQSMTNDPNAQQAAPVQPAKKSSALKWVLIGGCGCIGIAGIAFALIISLGVGGAFFAINQTKKTIAPTVSGHADAILSDDLEKAYSFCSDEFKSVTDMESYRLFVDTYKPVLVCKDVSITSFNLDNNVMTVVGKVTAEGGQQYSVTYQFIKKGDTWQIYGINIY